MEPAATCLQALERPGTAEPGHFARGAHHQKAGASADAAPNSAAIAHAAPSARLRPALKPRDSWPTLPYVLLS